MIVRNVTTGLKLFFESVALRPNNQCFLKDKANGVMKDKTTFQCASIASLLLTLFNVSYGDGGTGNETYEQPEIPVCEFDSALALLPDLLTVVPKRPGIPQKWNSSLIYTMKVIINFGTILLTICAGAKLRINRAQQKRVISFAL